MTVRLAILIPVVGATCNVYTHTYIIPSNIHDSLCRLVADLLVQVFRDHFKVLLRVNVGYALHRY